MPRGQQNPWKDYQENWQQYQWDPTLVDGKLDLSDQRTLMLDNPEYGDKIEKYETWFIDDLYGTDDARWTKGDVEGGNTPMVSADVEATWGLDLRRVFKDDLSIGSPEHYEHLTKGEVDWAHYENSSKYQEAFEYLVKNSYDPDKGGPVDHYSPLGTHNWDEDDYGSMWDKSTDAMKVQFIRDANAALKEGIDTKSEDAWKTEWEGKYDPNHITRKSDGTLLIDGEAQQTIKDQIASGEINADVSSFSYTRKDPDGNDITVTADAEGNLSDNAFDPIAGPPTAVVRPNIKTPSVNVKIPANVPQGWHGDVKSTIKISDYAGGKKE